MKKRILYGSWICLYILCAILGHTQQPQGAQAAAMTALGVLFFLPGFLLLADARRSAEEKQLRLLRWISGLSLALTLVAVLLNIFSALWSDALGTAMYEVLLFVSVPMLCCRYWALSLFLWACILFAALPRKKKK